MSEHTYKTIVDRAKTIKNKVEKEYTLGTDGKNQLWSYYICKAILNPKKPVKKLSFKNPPKPSGNYISRQIIKKDYIDRAKYLVQFVEKNKRLPNYLKWNDLHIKPKDYCYLFARILVWYDGHKAYPNNANIISKAYTKPTEYYQTVYDLFVKTFGKISCIDDALEYIDSKGYGYYYDDVYSNKESIQRMRNGQGVNCTDSCQVFYNLGLYFVAKGKYKKVECLHIKCRGGDGHVRLRFTLPNGEFFLRDPASVLDGNGVESNWCLDGSTLAIDPSWFMANLNR